MEIMNTAANPLAPVYPLDSNEVVQGTDGNAAESQSNGAASAPAATGDTVSISPMAQTMASNDIAMMAGVQALSLEDPFDTTSFSSTKAGAQLGNDTVSFDNVTGTVSWNNVNLKLAGVADTKKDNVAIQEENGYLYVYNNTDSANKKVYQFELNGSRAKDLTTGEFLETTRAQSGSQATLIINNSGNIA